MTPEQLAQAIYDALKEADPDQYLGPFQVVPFEDPEDPEGPTTCIDGDWDLVAVARRILAAGGETP